MNKETIFICFICIAAMGITLYLVFKKSNDVEKNIQKRCDEIENLLARSSPIDDIHNMYNLPYSKPSSCKSSMCDLEPFRFEDFDIPKEESPKEDIPKEDIPKEDIPKEDIPKEDVLTPKDETSKDETSK
nr:015R [Iridovirus CN01]